MLLNSKAEQKSAGVRLSGAPDRGVRRIARRSHFLWFGYFCCLSFRASGSLHEENRLIKGRRFCRTVKAEVHGDMPELIFPVITLLNFSYFHSERTGFLYKIVYIINAPL